MNHNENVLAIKCPLCWAGMGRHCQRGPAGNHAVRYKAAETKGLLPAGHTDHSQDDAEVIRVNPAKPVPTSPAAYAVAPQAITGPPAYKPVTVQENGRVAKPRRQKVARPKLAPPVQDGLFDITEILGG